MYFLANQSNVGQSLSIDAGVLTGVVLWMWDQVAIAWCISKGTIPIPGAKTVRQATDNLGALSFKLSGGEVAALEDAARGAPRSMIQNVFQTQ